MTCFFVTGLSSQWLAIAVRTTVGATPLTVMPCRASSIACCFTSYAALALGNRNIAEHHGQRDGDRPMFKALSLSS